MHENHTRGQVIDLALWRYGVISQLLHLEQGESQRAVLTELATRIWMREDRPVRVSQETIRKWLYRYRRGGLPGLQNQVRKDKGRISLPQALADALFQLRGEHPRWTTQRLLDHLMEQGRWNGRKPSRTAIYRFVKTHNLGRNPIPAAETGRAFAFDAFGQMWLADFMHGPKIRVGRNRRKTYLHVILDDCSRYVVQARFSLAENVETLLGELHDAIRRFGVPQRFYTDNGACYRSRHLKLACARLGIELVHTPPYRPQGRGKVERLFRTVREQWLQDQPVRSLDGLNKALANWITTYHQRRHDTLEGSPLAKRLGVRNAARPLPETADLRALFLMERRCRLYKDGTIRLYGRTFEILDPPPGPRVTVYFMPWDLDHVTYGDQGLPARPLNRHTNAHRCRPPRTIKEDRDD